MSSIFSKIIRGELPSYKIAESDDYYAFLDINPIQEGHTLVVPKVEEDYLFDLGDQELQSLMVFSKKVALAIEKSIPCERIGVTVIGEQEKVCFGLHNKGRKVDARSKLSNIFGRTCQEIEGSLGRYK